MHVHKMNKIYYTKFYRSIRAYCIAGMLYLVQACIVSGEKAGAISESFADQFYVHMLVIP